MPDVSGPWDPQLDGTGAPIPGSSPWAEAQWYRHAAMWAPSGAYGPPAASTTTGDLPLSVSALTVGLGAGRANVRGAGFERTGAAVMQAVSANTHASFSRRDRIVLRRNLATHTVTPVLLTGTPAGNPAAPALTLSDAGSWDLPMFSFLVPPNSGTSITGIVDERGWVNGSDTLEVPSIAVRDAHFPSPTKGQACTVNGNPHTHDGTGWRFTLYFKLLSVGTDGTGIFQIQHLAGQAPLAWGATLLNQSSDTVTAKLHVVAFGADSTNLSARFAMDGNYYVGTVSFSAWARF